MVVRKSLKIPLGDTVMLLLDANYETTVRYDEKGLGIVVIEFDHDRNLAYGNSLPYWLSPKEFESVVWDDETDIKEW